MGGGGGGGEKGGSPFALSFSVLKKKRKRSLGNCKLVVLSQSQILNNNINRQTTPAPPHTYCVVCVHPCSHVYVCELLCGAFLSGVAQSKSPVFLREAGQLAQQREVWLAPVQQRWVNRPVKGTLGAVWDFSSG